MFSAYSKTKGIGLTVPIHLEGSVYMYVCMCVCVYVYVYIYTQKYFFIKYTKYYNIIAI